MSDIAIIIPARNAAATLAETLQSVLSSPAVGDVIVVDDGSTDNTALVALGVGDPRIRIVQGPQAGVAAALNAGLAACTKPYVARCDADDLYPPDRLAWQRAWLDDHPDYVAVTGGFTTMLSDGFEIADLAIDGIAREVTDALLRGETVTSLCTWLIRAEALSMVHGAREWFASAEDVDLQCRLAEIGRVWHVPRIAYYYRLHDASITHSRPKEIVKFYDVCARRFARERREHGRDALQRGSPPVPPVSSSKLAQQNPALGQAIGHAVGAAWAEFATGGTDGAYRRLRSLALKYPSSWYIWRHLGVLSLKYHSRNILRRLNFMKVLLFFIFLPNLAIYIDKN
jgi:glycosyltransferase involved in cell wall biosynthesis